MGDKIEKTVAAINAMQDTFKYERLVYLFITVSSTILLIVAGIYLFSSLSDLDTVNNTLSTSQYISVFGLCGSSGPLAFSIGRILKMYDKGMELIQTAIQNDNG
jgi:hypothetical protein